MVVFLPSTGPWSVLANGFFLCSALFGDILIIRFFLVLGFGSLIIWAATGCTLWPDGWHNLGTIAPWTILMAVGPFTLHLLALIRLIYAERKIKFKSENDESLWRFFYRRCGMHRLEFKRTLEEGEWVRYKAGECIMDTEVDQDKAQLFLIVEGRVRCYRNLKGLKTAAFKMYSGELFDLKAANIFGVRIGFFNNRFAAYAETEILCFRWSSAALFRLSSAPQPAISSFWEKFILYSVANEVNRKFYSRQGNLAGAIDSLGEGEDVSYYEGQRSRDFSPFRSFEEPPKFSFWKWVASSFSLHEPIGIRHTAPPTTGMLARNSLLAYTQRGIDRSDLSERESMQLSSSMLDMDLEVGRDKGSLRWRLTQPYIMLLSLRLVSLLLLACNVPRLAPSAWVKPYPSSVGYAKDPKIGQTLSFPGNALSEEGVRYLPASIPPPIPEQPSSLQERGECFPIDDGLIDEDSGEDDTEDASYAELKDRGERSEK